MTPLTNYCYYYYYYYYIYIYIYIYIVFTFLASFEKFESRTIWVDPYYSFRKKWSTFIKKGMYGLCFSNIFSKFWPRDHIVWLMSSFQGSYILSFHRSTLSFQGYTNIHLNPIYFLVLKSLLKKTVLWLDSYSTNINIFPPKAQCIWDRMVFRTTANRFFLVQFMQLSN